MTDPMPDPIPDPLAIAPSVLYFGTPVVLVVTRNADGRPNISPVSSVWALGSSVVIGIGAAGQCALNLERDGHCALNFPSADLWPRIEAIARTTGRDPVPREKAERGYVHAPDKFALGGFTPLASQTGGPPRIAECPLQMEGVLQARHRAAEPGHLIAEIGVTQVYAHRAIVLPGTDHIDTARWNPLFYVFRHYFGDAVDLGRNFRAET